MSVASCPLCGSTSRRRFAKHGFWIRDCERCGHRFAELDAGSDHVARTYGDDYFEGGGAGYSDYLAEGPILRERGVWYARLLARHMPPGKVLDVGSAAGFWLEGLLASGFQGKGIEPNAKMAAHARGRGLDVETGTIEDLDPSERYDLVSMIQVVAHFVDVRRALERAVEMVRPGGFLIVETWNRASWSARILGQSWHEYSPPSVLHWFTPDSLARFARELALREVARGRPRKRIGAGHAKSLLRYKYGSSAARLLLRPLDLVPDALSVPYPADDLFFMLLRRTDPV